MATATRVKKMTARYDGRCRACGGRLYAGDTIRYSRATGAMHATDADCEEQFDYEAEQRAEYRMSEEYRQVVRGFHDYVDDDGRYHLA